MSTNHESREETEMSTNHKTDAERLAAAPRWWWFPDNTGTDRTAAPRWWWFPDNTGTDRTPPAKTPEYVVLQVVLKERLIGTGSGNLSLLEDVINRQAAQGFRLHTITTVASRDRADRDRIQATLVFERLG